MKTNFISQKISFVSLPSIELTEGQINQRQFETLLVNFYPKLFRTYKYLKEYNVNADFLPTVIKSVANLSSQSGYGKVQIFITGNRINAVKPEINHKLDVPVLEEEENLTK